MFQNFYYPDSSYIVSTSQQFQQNFTLYPNPSANKIRINFNQNLAEEITIHLYNSLGHLVYEEPIEKGESMTELEVGLFPRGVYFLVINGEEVYFSEKVIFR